MNPLTIQLEIQTAEDRWLLDVCEIEQLSFEDPYPRRLIYALAQLYQDTFLVALARGKVAGYAIYSDGEAPHLISLAVHPSYRRRGIGEALMRAVLRHTKGAMVLEVRENNMTAIELYRKLGFKSIGRVANYYEDGADAVTYQAAPQ